MGFQLTERIAMLRPILLKKRVLISRLVNNDSWSIERLQEIHVNYLKTAKCYIYVAAAVSFVFSVCLWFTHNRTEALFVGLWVPSILSFGILYLLGKEK